MTLMLLMNLGFAGGGGAVATPRRMMTMGIGSAAWWTLIIHPLLTLMDRNPQLWNS